VFGSCIYIVPWTRAVYTFSTAGPPKSEQLAWVTFAAQYLHMHTLNKPALTIYRASVFWEKLDRMVIMRDRVARGGRTRKPIIFVTNKKRRNTVTDIHNKCAYNGE
jgi:hypothetical protein